MKTLPIIFILLIFISSCTTEKFESYSTEEIDKEIEPLEESNKEIKKNSNVNLVEKELNENLEDESDLADADVLFVKAVKMDVSWTFYVTVTHPDTGWGDYVDGWDVVLPDGTVIKPDGNKPFTRQLMHPHVNEQPFIRSQSRIVIPNDIKKVSVRAHDLIEGFGGNEIVLNLIKNKGENYELVNSE